MRTRAALELTAHHEAGHVVAGHLLGLTLLGADLDPDPQGGLGHTQFAPSSRRDREFVEAVVTAYLAGFVAESRQAGSEAWDGAGFDLQESTQDWLALDQDPTESVPDRLRRLRERAEGVLASNWALVDAVAAGLLAEHRLPSARLIETMKLADPA